MAQDMTEEQYVEMAHAELSALIATLDGLESDALQADLENDIITIELGDDVTYVINSHRAARQIWMAAERTAWHFDFDVASKQWIAAKNGDELWSALKRVLSERLGDEVVAALVRLPH